MLLKLLQRLGARRPYFHIVSEKDGSLYMGRWWLFGGSDPARDSDTDRPVPRTWKRSRIDAAIGKHAAGRLHHIAREDRARDLHTHPASFISIVIAGWYVERRPVRQSQHPILDATEYVDIVRRPGSIAFRRARDRHTITHVSPGGCWTVVVWFKKLGSWGFWTKNGFINWRNYKVQP